jgi:hypothetical protein
MLILKALTAGVIIWVELCDFRRLHQLRVRTTSGKRAGGANGADATATRRWSASSHLDAVGDGGPVAYQRLAPLLPPCQPAGVHLGDPVAVLLSTHHLPSPAASALNGYQGRQSTGWVTEKATPAKGENTAGASGACGCGYCSSFALPGPTGHTARDKARTSCSSALSLEVLSIGSRPHERQADRNLTADSNRPSEAALLPSAASCCALPAAALMLCALCSVAPVVRCGGSRNVLCCSRETANAPVRSNQPASVTTSSNAHSQQLKQPKHGYWVAQPEKTYIRYPPANG